MRLKPESNFEKLAAGLYLSLKVKRIHSSCSDLCCLLHFREIRIRLYYSNTCLGVVSIHFVYNYDLITNSKKKLSVSLSLVSCYVLEQ